MPLLEASRKNQSGIVNVTDTVWRESSYTDGMKILAIPRFV